MCGFFFEFSNKIINKNKSQIINLKNCLHRRGPDNFSYIKEKNFIVAFSRLSVQDINKRSNQPFTDKEKRYFLIFNGELYNFLDLKKELKYQGIKFNTKSDTEVLFNLLKFKGLKYTLKVIKGMFSFIFIDKKKNIFYGARDHFGQKPLYYCKLKNNFQASTNIRSILDNVDYKLKKIDYESVSQYLFSSGIISQPKTFFKNISALPAGTYFEFKNNKLKLKKYFNVYDLIDKNKYFIYKNKNRSEILDILDQKINNAVKKHIVSDARLGVTSSGGIDSSLILHYTSKLSKNLKIFTNKSYGIEKLSSNVTKIVKHNNINKKKICFINQYKKEYFKNLCSLTKYSLFPARWGGGPPMRKLCEAAKKKQIKVLIGGDGVDEFFCGYKTFKNIFFKNKNKHNLHEILNINSKSNVSKNFYKPIISSKKKIEKKISFIKDFNEKKLITNSLLDIEFFLQSCTLPHTDEYSMFESIELRSPFLDLDLVEFCINLPLKFKINSKNKYKSKYLFRQLAIQKYGKFIDKPKEGTRNYSKFISNKKFWNLENFLILKKIKLNNNLHYKQLFKLINLEILLRALNKDTKNINNILSRNGIKALT